MFGPDNFSQASVRSYRIFRDQHGRKWGASCENKTGHPCGPLTPKFSAPIYPPEGKYIRFTDTAAGEIFIDYDAWIEDEQHAHEEWQRTLEAVAFDMFDSRAADAIKNHDPALYRRVGERPKPVERVLACKAGNKWVLGLRQPNGEPYPKPSWAEKYFPTEPAVVAMQFPDFDEEGPAEVERPLAGADDDVAYPQTLSPGKHRLSNGTIFKGTREAAEDAEDALQKELAGAGAGAGKVDPSWTT